VRLLDLETTTARAPKHSFFEQTTGQVATRLIGVSLPTHPAALNDLQVVGCSLRELDHLIGELVEHPGTHIQANAELPAQRHQPHGQVGNAQQRVKILSHCSRVPRPTRRFTCRPARTPNTCWLAACKSLIVWNGKRFSKLPSGMVESSTLVAGRAQHGQQLRRARSASSAK
jgi:hypothetical protein